MNDGDSKKKKKSLRQSNTCLFANIVMRFVNQYNRMFSHTFISDETGCGKAVALMMIFFVMQV